MVLTTMTPEWRQIANDITVFIIRQREHNEAKLQELASAPLDLYNRWVRNRGCAIYSTELALWCVDYMQNIAKMPLVKLIKAANIDGLRY